MAVIKFAAYREYEKMRVEASNAMMGLLAGAQLASHLLQLTEGSERLLPEVYPRVAHIGRFNLTTERAQDILREADTHLGGMGVPYALAMHEDYMKTCLGILVRDGQCTPAAAKVNLNGQHATFENCTGFSFDAVTMAQLDTLRLMRNCIIHAGGRANKGLIDKLNSWSDETEHGWVQLTQRNPRHVAHGQRLTFTQGEMILALAVTKNLDRQANEALGASLSRTLWAELLVEDLLQDYPSALRAPDGLRRAKGLARHRYSPVALTEDEIKSAMNKKKQDRT